MSQETNIPNKFLEKQGSQTPTQADQAESVFLQDPWLIPMSIKT
jgi:hypothetical protein